MIFKNPNGTDFCTNMLYGWINYIPHPTQLLIHNSNSRFRFLACGRRWGKTLLASKELLNAAIAHSNHRYWIVAPNYSLTEKVFREVLKDLTFTRLKAWVKKASEADMKIYLTNNTIIECKSADNPESLLGEGLNGMVIDEAARIKDSIWHEYLRPTLSDKQGWLLAISTPKGQNWFYQGFVNGQKKVEETESWNFTTADNPYIKPEEIALAKTTMPERAFQQEYLGVFLGSVGGVFRNVRDCIDSSYEMRNTCEGGVSYVIGVDLAKYQDFTVITVIDKRYNRVIWFERFNQIDWTLQEKRIIDCWHRFAEAEVFVDATGVGDRVFEELAKTITNINGVKFTGVSKTELIDELSIMMDNKLIHFPDIPELVDELNIYEYEITRAGNVRLNAPVGYHDDCVISLSLAAQGIKAGFTINNFTVA
jgi:tRNA isopentenyl-2-thiomethyl-A-37 hydroxylase MiaE